MDLIQEIEQKLGLVFFDNAEINLCFATQNDELRTEFKVFFTRKDVAFFIKSFKGKTIIIPATTALFWQKVADEKNK